MRTSETIRLTIPHADMNNGLCGDEEGRNLAAPNDVQTQWSVRKVSSDLHEWRNDFPTVSTTDPAKLKYE